MLVSISTTEDFYMCKRNHKNDVPLIIIPLCTFICVLPHVVCVECSGNTYECALPTTVLIESDFTVTGMHW